MTRTSGLFLRNPQGGVENVSDMKASGAKWITFNTGDFPVSQWTTVIERAKDLGLVVFPWKYLRSVSDILSLINDAHAIGATKVMLNLEVEAETVLPPALVRDVVESQWRGEVGVSTLGWLQNDVDFTPFKKYTVLLQIFPQDMRRDPATLPELTRDCIAHARAHGLVNIGVTFQTYGSAKREWYSFWKWQRSYYTADDMQPPYDWPMP